MAALSKEFVFPHYRNPHFTSGQRHVAFLRLPGYYGTLLDNEITPEIRSRLAGLMRERDGRLFTSAQLQQQISDAVNKAAWERATKACPVFSAEQIQEYLRNALHMPRLELIYLESGVAGDGGPEVQYGCLLAS